MKFPQNSLLADRKSMFNVAFNFGYKERVRLVKEILLTESIQGSKKFVSGIGKHGKFYNISKKSIKPWELE